MDILCRPRKVVKHKRPIRPVEVVHHTYRCPRFIPAAKTFSWVCLAVGALGGGYLILWPAPERLTAKTAGPVVAEAIPSPAGFLPEFLLPGRLPAPGTALGSADWYPTPYDLSSVPMQLAFFGPPDFFPPPPQPTPPQPGQPDTQSPELPPWMQKSVPERETRQPAPVPAPEPGSGIILATAIVSGALALTGKRL